MSETATSHQPESASTTAPPLRRGWARWRRPLLEALVVLTILVGVRTWRARTLRAGSVAASVLTDLEGHPVTLGGAHPRPRLVWFFASWCTVCRATEHNIRALANDAGVEVIAVASESGDAEAVRSFVRAQGLTGASLRVVNDPHSALARRFGVQAFPTAFVLDTRGSIRSTEVGFTSELGLRARIWLAK